MNYQETNVNEYYTNIINGLKNAISELEKENQDSKALISLLMNNIKELKEGDKDSLVIRLPFDKEDVDLNLLYVLNDAINQFKDRLSTEEKERIKKWISKRF